MTTVNNQSLIPIQINPRAGDPIAGVDTQRLSLAKNLYDAIEIVVTRITKCPPPFVTIILQECSSAVAEPAKVKHTAA